MAEMKNEVKRKVHGSCRNPHIRKERECVGHPALAEKALIRHFLSRADDLVNVSGVRISRHELASSGNHPKRFFPRVVYLEKSKGD
jgi:hypothetical protein